MEELIEITKNLSKKWGVEISEINGEEDHLHILFNYYPQMQLSKYVNNLKTVTSRLVNKNNEEYLSTFYWKDEDETSEVSSEARYVRSVLWTKSYFIASCGGVTVEKLKEYIKTQDSPDS